MNFIKNYFVKKWSKEISREQADEEMRKAERVLKHKAEEHLAITLGRLLDLREFTWADYSMHQIHYETARSLAMALDITGLRAVAEVINTKLGELNELRQQVRGSSS